MTNAASGTKSALTNTWIAVKSLYPNGECAVLDCWLHVLCCRRVRLPWRPDGILSTSSNCVTPWPECQSITGTHYDYTLWKNQRGILALVQLYLYYGSIPMQSPDTRQGRRNDSQRCGIACKNSSHPLLCVIHYRIQRTSIFLYYSYNQFQEEQCMKTIPKSVITC